MLHPGLCPIDVFCEHRSFPLTPSVLRLWVDLLDVPWEGLYHLSSRVICVQNEGPSLRCQVGQGNRELRWNLLKKDKVKEKPV